MTVGQQKLVATAQSLEMVIDQDLANTNNVSELWLTGYKITGTGGSVPNIVALLVEDINSSSQYMSIKGTARGLKAERTNLYAIYPPGGLDTEGRVMMRVGYKPMGQLDFSKPKLVLRNWDDTLGSFVDWNDWTNAVFTFKLTARAREPTVRHKLVPSRF